KNINNPAIFRATMPSCEEMATALQELTFKELEDGSTLFGTSGFVPNPITGELVSPFPGGYSFIARKDEKIIPSEAVSRMVEKRISAMTDQGVDVNREQRLAIKDDVIAVMAARAFTCSKYAHCFYSTDHQLLFVVGTNPMVNQALSMALRCVGTIKTTTIHIDGVKNGLTAILKQYVTQIDDGAGLLDGSDLFAGFGLGDRILMSKLSSDEKMLIDGTDMSSSVELRTAIESGFTVDVIRLEEPSGMSFDLDHKFKVSRISWPQMPRDEDGDYDMPFYWRQDASIQVLMLSKIVNSMCALLSKEESGDTEAA
ncbi:MAG: recombination-associated protein RdgC, partial [Plesiomonas shigelloides]